MQLSTGQRVVLIYNVGPREEEEGAKTGGETKACTEREDEREMHLGVDRELLESAFARKANAVVLARLLLDFKVGIMSRRRPCHLSHPRCHACCSIETQF